MTTNWWMYCVLWVTGLTGSVLETGTQSTVANQCDSLEWLYCNEKMWQCNAVILSHGKQSHYSKRYVSLREWERESVCLCVRKLVQALIYKLYTPTMWVTERGRIYIVYKANYIVACMCFTASMMWFEQFKSAKLWKMKQQREFNS